ncbi:MAG: hypothetical protein ACRD3B_13445 [Candidatus Sulfotelmatobacter sp.]
MTIAIGAEMLGGIVIGADTKVVSNDGATTTGSKISLNASLKSKALLAIANAAEDGRAATMLAEEMVSAVLNASQDGRAVDRAIKKVMGTWHRSYGQTQPPVVEFLLALSIQSPRSIFGLFYCQPPSTRMRCREPMAIGRGSRPVDPLLKTLLRGELNPKSALLKLAYLMRVAKSEEGSACGDDTQAIIVTTQRTHAWINKNEMADAERLAEECRELIDQHRVTLLSAEKPEWIEPHKDDLFETFTVFLKKAEALEFPSLRFLQPFPTKEPLKNSPIHRRSG